MNIPRIHDDDPARRREREDQLRIRLAEQELSGIVKPTPDPKMEMQKMAATRAGGAYIPPARRMSSCPSSLHPAFQAFVHSQSLIPFLTSSSSQGPTGTA